jgi:hypothetical protein
MIEGQAIVATIDAARFRGEYLDCCAQIEHHACAAIDRLVQRGRVKKAPYLFGQKFELLRKHAEEAGLWTHYQHVAQALDHLVPYVELRGTICHAVFSPAYVENEAGISWRMPGEAGWRPRRTMTETEMLALLCELRERTAKFLKQKLKAD